MHLAKNGLMAVTVDYRLTPTWKHPSQIDYVRSVLAWISTRQECYRIDANRLGLFGYSSGGHLVCLVWNTRRRILDHSQSMKLFQHKTSRGL
jgi:acetyl esterase/lipase